MIYHLKMMAIITLLNFLAVAPASASKIALLVGGSGEDTSRTNPFEDSFAQYQQRLQKKGWEVATLFDGLKNAVPSSLPANEKNIEDQLAAIEKRAKPGDEVLLYFNGHGRSPNFLQDSHDVVVDGGTFDMQKMKDLSDRLQKKGIKAALVDLSCYSGSDQVSSDSADPRPPYCLVTLAARNYVSVCVDGADKKAQIEGFTRDFTTPAIDAEENLEDIYLRARANDRSDFNLPAISSIDSPFFKSLNSILISISAQANSELDSWFGEDSDDDPNKVETASGAKETRACDCVVGVQKGLRELQTLSNQLHENMGSIAHGLDMELDKLLTSYRELLSSWKPIAQAFHDGFKWGYPDMAEMSLPEVLEILDILDSSKENHVPLEEIAWLTNSEREQVKKFASRRDKLTEIIGLQKEKYKDLWKKYENAKTVVSSQTGRVLREERKLYQATVEKNRMKGDDPCKNFRI